MFKEISIKEFRKQGYLQELNRQFLHPLGMALQVIIREDGTEELHSIWDYRDDPEGMLYADSVIKTNQAKINADNVLKQYEDKSIYRKQKYGWVIQPIYDELKKKCQKSTYEPIENKEEKNTKRSYQDNCSRSVPPADYKPPNNPPKQPH